MKRILMCGVLASVTLILASSAVADVVGNFEGTLDGWRAGDGMTLSFSATGATAGAQALQIDGSGGWHISALLDAKSQRANLGKKGVKVTADVTAVAGEMTSGWMQVEIVVNAQNNNDSGANNNIGWNQLGGQDVAIDGQPHTLTWTLSDDLAGKIAAADDNISWFELALVSNLDSASVTRFYLDNVQVVAPEVATTSVVIGNFENGLDGWYTDTYTGGTTAAGATGATLGAQAMQVDAAGGWQQLTKVDVKPHMAMLATKGVKITADVTAFAADMTTTWFQVGMVINAQNNNDNGANNNLGWNDLGLQDVAIDGQAHTLTWTLADDVTAKIAGANADIGWFEVLLISNDDSASTTRFYIDNIQIVSPATDTGKATDTVIGNWEQSMDGWVVGGGADVRYSDTNGVTLGEYSLDVYTPTGAWASVLTMNLLDPNNAAVLAAFRTNTKLSVDITHLVRDWPVDKIPPWNGTHLIINTDASAVPSQAGGYINLGYKAGWSQSNGDRTDTATWDYSQVIADLNANWDKVTYLSLEVVANANSADYTGWVWFYMDNMRLSGGGIPMTPQPANGAKDVRVDTVLSWTGGAYAASHNLYLGTSSSAVATADGNSDPTVRFVTLDGTSFDPNGLEYNTQYFWRVDAVNDVNPDSPWTSGVWNFTTGNFLVVDDFESYQDVLGEGKAIFDTWLDGWQDEDNGSIVGYDEAPFCKDTVTAAHGGEQLMPLRYDNTTATVSEAMRVWPEPQDWTVNSFNTLRLFVAGKAYNVPGVLYITLVDDTGASYTVQRDIAEASLLETWTELEIPLNEFTGVDMASITSMAIGIMNKAGAEKAVGTLLIDDIRVGVRAMGLVARYKLDGNLDDSTGNGHNGVFGGDPNFPATYVTGPTGFGKGLLFDGTGGHQNVECGTFNPSAATGQLTISTWAKWDGPSDQWQGLMGKRDAWTAEDTMWHLEVNKDAGTIGFARWDVYPGSGSAKLPVGTWAHVAVTFDGTTARFYLNGVETGNGAFSFGPKKDARVHFGSDDPEGGNAFNGALDDVRLYDKALSADEVKALMSSN
ncbi:MAG: LamG domain-containing protein [Solirubrobacterales bacterium]